MMELDAPQASSTVVADGESPSAQPPPQPTTARRSRVSLACQRCKHRKQKCNGTQPTCGRCMKLKVPCHYVMPARPRPVQASIYIKALEDRVAELETLLKKGGDVTSANDHWAAAATTITTTTTATTSGIYDQVDDVHEDHNHIQPLLNAVRDLSLDVAGSYIGGASTITLGRALGVVLAGRPQLSLAATSPEDMTIGNAASVQSNASCLGSGGFSLISQVSQETADAMVNAYLKHSSTNFPIIFSFDILDMHKRRHDLDDVYEESILHLIYGLGSHFLEKTGESKVSHDPEQYYFAALEERDTILPMGDTRALTYLMLLGQFCYRMPREPGAWTFFGLAMKMCIELGLHRQKKSSRVCLKSEQHKRLFWSCYWHEREIAIAMGRPPSLSDHDIDVELPLDINEDTRDLDVLWKATEQDRSVPSYPPTTMSTLIHLLRLKRIESEIQHQIYRVDKVKSSQEVYAETGSFLQRLRAWKSAIPQYQADQSMPENQVYLSYDSYMAAYYKTLRILLQPRLYEKTLQEQYLELCAEACRGVCETYKRLHTKLPVAFNSLSLQSVFLAGLTLIYCMWLDASNSKAYKNHGALTDCSIMLYVMAERWPVGRKYRDMFEVVKTALLEAIEEGHHVPRSAVTSLRDNGGVQTPWQQLQVDAAAVDSMTDDLEQMIGDMTGEAISVWQDDALLSWDASEASVVFNQLD